MGTAAIQHRPPRRDQTDVGKTANDAQHIIDALGDAKDVRLVVGQRTEVPLPAGALDVLVAALKQLANGKQVSIVPVDAEMTTQEAADLLRVSRPYLIGLLDAGKIPYRKVGTKRRLLVADVLAYKSQDDKRRRKLLDELSAEAQKLGLY